MSQLDCAIAIRDWGGGQLPIQQTFKRGRISIPSIILLMTSTGLEVAFLAVGCYGLAKGAYNLTKLNKLSQAPNKMGKIGFGKLTAASEKVANVAVKVHDVIHVIPQGVAVPSAAKYRIPSSFIENKYRPGSYGEMINGRFQERLRIDPPTLP